METTHATAPHRLTHEHRARMADLVNRIKRISEERPRRPLGWHESLGAFILGLIADDCRTLAPWHVAFLAGSCSHDTELPRTDDSGVRLLGEIAFAGCQSTAPTNTHAMTDERLDDIERWVELLA